MSEEGNIIVPETAKEEEPKELPDIMDRTHRCGTCPHFVVREDITGMDMKTKKAVLGGECRRYPPNMLIFVRQVKEQPKIQTAGVQQGQNMIQNPEPHHAYRTEYDWCGEHPEIWKEHYGT